MITNDTADSIKFRGNSESPVSLTYMSLDSGKQQAGAHAETHAGTGFEPRTLLLWGEGANHCINVISLKQYDEQYDMRQTHEQFLFTGCHSDVCAKTLRHKHPL